MCGTPSYSVVVAIAAAVVRRGIEKRVLTNVVRVCPTAVRERAQIDVASAAAPAAVRAVSVTTAPVIVVPVVPVIAGASATAATAAVVLREREKVVERVQQCAAGITATTVISSVTHIKPRK